MGLRLLIDDSESVTLGAMYDSTSDVAFGPVYYGDDRFEVQDHFTAFWAWLDEEHGIRDARMPTPALLMSYYADWRAAGGGHE